MLFDLEKNRETSFFVSAMFFFKVQLIKVHSFLFFGREINNFPQLTQSNESREKTNMLHAFELKDDQIS